MPKLSELSDQVLLLEYKESVERLERLSPDLPKRMHDIRAKYRDYIAAELRTRGLIVGDLAEVRPPLTVSGEQPRA